jgi:hypothetical protein
VLADLTARLEFSMNSTQSLVMFFSSALAQSPIFFVALAGCVITFQKWRQAPRAALWAMLGFGLALALCLIVPLVQTLVQSWAMRGEHANQGAYVLTGLGLFWSLLRAVSYAFLLVAVFAGRSAPIR